MASDDQDFVVLEGQDLADFNNAGLLPQSSDTINRILGWLKPTDYKAESSEYNKHLASYVDGTGVWIQESSQYQEWLNSKNGALWIKATAGAGKSVVAAHVPSLLATKENVPVLSFFFRQIIATNRTPQALIRDWLAQLLRFSPPLQKKLRELLDQRRGLETLALDELWDIALSGMASCSRTYCIVDALDEMDGGNEEFMRKLVRLAEGKSSIKLLVTSRPLPHIEKILSNPLIAQLPLRPQQVDRDIAIYIKERLHSTKFPAEAKAAIEDVLGRKSQGLFLYSRLMLDEIMETGFTDFKSLHIALDGLPSGLGDMYTKMLLDHSSRSGTPQDLQLFILKCVTHSSRPLRLLELSTMVDFVRKSPRTHFAPDVPPSTMGTKAIVRTGCGPLLEILEDETVSIIHHSLTEYLTSASTVGSLQEFSHIDSKDAHLNIAKTCIDYLLSDDLSDSKTSIDYLLSGGVSDRETIQNTTTDEQRNLNVSRLRHPFLDYATKYWAYHALKCEKDDRDLFQRLDLLLDARCPTSAAESKPAADETSAIHIAASSGLAFYIKHLLEAGHDANSLDRQQRTPLHLAANNGFEKVVEELAKHGAELCKDDYAGYTPIHLAASANRKDAVRALLKAGVSPLERRTHDHPGNWCGNARHDTGVTPLQYACEYGHTETVPEFFPYLDEQSLSQALLWALQYGKAETASYILKHSKVDVNRVVGRQTAIHIATWSHDLISIQNLITHGADIKLKLNNINSRIYYMGGDHQPSVSSTPFQTFLQFSRGYPVPIKASPEDSFEILKILVEAGCDLNEKDSAGQTAFHKILNGCQRMPNRISQEIIQYMFANGADSSILTKDGSTALHLMPCHLDSAIESLVAGGIDVNSRRKSDGRTPLFGALGSAKHVSLFVKLGADCNIQDAKGDTPLHVAIAGLGYSESPEGTAAIKKLLEAGADPQLKNKAGLAPIHTIQRVDHKHSLLVLIEAGASLESRTNAGYTVLLAALRGHSFYDRDIQMLLDLGADVHARDFAGKTALHYCCAKDDGLDFLIKLVDAGADPMACDYSGNTLFHEAASVGPTYHDQKQLKLLEKLLELGVDPKVTNHSGQTPVHRAVGDRRSISNYKTDPLDFLLGPKCNVDIDAPDNLGIRAIHLAATLGEAQVKQVLKKGADPMVITLDGQTALHVASRSRQCNAVGLLTDLYLKAGKAGLIDQVDQEGRTALHYAVLSGRPESVAILINIGGADPNLKDSKNLTPLRICALIEEEDTHWSLKHEADIAAVGVSLNDPFRSSGVYGGETPELTSGTREIVRLLISHGAGGAAIRNLKQLRQRSQDRTGLLAYAVKAGSEILVDELLDVEENTPLPESVPAERSDEDEDEFPGWYRSQSASVDKFEKTYSSLRIQNVGFLEGLVKPGESNFHLFKQLLSQSHKKGIWKMKALGADMVQPEAMGSSCVTTLINGGHASLLELFGDEVKRMDAGWIKETEKSNVNLPGRLFPPILIASQRALPNLEVLKVLVGKFGVDVNVQFEIGRFNSYNEGKTALHMVASCKQWWHEHAVKYLLENGANPDIQDKEGDTALHLAVKSANDVAVSHLLSHGANPNVLNNAQASPLTAASSSSSIISLLVSHGADVSAGIKPFIFTCIEEQDLSAIRLLVSMSTNLNVKLPPAEEPVDSDDDYGVKIKRYALKRINYDSREAAENSFPVHFAAGPGFNTGEKREKMIPIIEVLLEGGADPQLSFNDDGDGIIGDICVRGGILPPFLQIPDLDLEVRDSKGRTLLLGACTTEENWNKHYQRALSLPSDVSLLLERGADITAVDNEGRNVLYHLLTSSVRSKGAQAHHPSDLDTILAHPLASQLVVQKDNNGTTSLQHALRMGQFKAVELLLAKGADPLEPDREGNTALHYLAAYAGGNDFVDLTFFPDFLMKTFGAGIFEEADAADYPDYSKPTFRTALFNKFLEFGVDINARNKIGETCLFGFLSLEKVKLIHVKFFEENGSDFTVVNVKGEGLLHACAKGRQIPTGSSVASSLCGDLENWEEQEEGGELPDIDGIKGYKGVKGKAGLFKWLMEVKGLDPLAEDIESRSALDIATASGQTKILELFKRKES